MKKINIILPVYNESDSIFEFQNYLTNYLTEMNYKFTITIIDDGSDDDSWLKLQKLEVNNNYSYKLIKFSRNFGHQAAIFSGLENFNEDAAIVMDADFQDDPKYISELLNEWEEGKKIVLAKRTRRNENIFRKIIFKIFYSIQQSMSEINLPKNVGHFSLLDKEIVEKINLFPERNRYFNGLRAFVSYEVGVIDVEKQSRKFGSTKMTLSKFISLAFRGIFDYGTKPIRFIGLAGILISLGSIFFSLIVFIQSQIYNIKVFNWDFGLSSIYFLSGIQLFSISVIGEYISNIFIEVKKRPNYIIEKIINF